jgi:hypothetical protein
MNAIVKTEVDVGRVKGIQLPIKSLQQVLAQFADDTSFILLGEEGSVRHLVSVLDSFCLASGLVFNWLKSSAYWKCFDRRPRLGWTDRLGVQ